MIKVYSEDYLQENPRKKANWLSFITFWFTLGTFQIGRKRDLYENDLTQPLDEHKSSLLGDEISRIWSREYYDSLKRKRKPSMLKVIIKTFYRDIIKYAIILFLMELFIRLSLPMCIGFFIRYFRPGNQNYTGPEKYPMYFNRFLKFDNESVSNPIRHGEAYFFGIGILLCSFIILFVFHPYMLAIYHVGMKMRVACCSLIYRKTLRITLSAAGGHQAGNPVNLMSNDVIRFDLAAIFLHYLWLSPLQAIALTYFIYLETELAAGYGALVLVIVIPIQICFGYFTSKYRYEVASKTDNRVTEMNELVKAMQVIKMYAWEHPFAQLIHNLRATEMKYLKYTNYIRAGIMSFIMFTSRSGICVTVIAYVLLGNNVTAEKVFLVSAYYQIMRQTMTVYFPQGISTICEALVSIKRIEQFMLLEESIVGNPEPLNPELLFLSKERKSLAEIFEGIRHSELRVPTELPQIVIERAVAMYKNNVALSNIDVKFYPNGPTIIIGPVGSGKSCLLHLILGELALIKGSVEIKGQISYASQEPWLFEASVRQNILFGRDFNRQRYREVVKVCALNRDFLLLPYGDQTIIGERGESLSGGQRARVNLARAVYCEADIYLLDDPLSAVDIQVGNQLFNDCIVGYLKNKIVVLVTHQLQFLPQAAHIVVMEDGLIAEQGTFDTVFKDVEFGEIYDAASESFHVDASRGSIVMPTRMGSILRQISATSFKSISTLKTPTIVPEIRSLGAVNFEIYKGYFKAVGNWCWTIMLVFLFLFAQGLASGGDFFLSQWVVVEEFQYGKLKRLGEFWESIDRNTYITTYALIMIATVIVVLGRSFYFFNMCNRASLRLHDEMYKCITQATMRFFQENSSGRILNRFSKDLGAVDELLPNALIDTVQLLLNLLGAFVVILFIEPILIIFAILITIAFYYLRKCYLATSRSVKRLDAITRSPVFNHLNATLEGLPTIRINEAEMILVQEFDKLQDINSSAWYMFLYTSRAFSYFVDLICSTFIGVVVFIFLIFSESYTGSGVGLVITQCMGLSGLVQWGMRQSAELENQMTSVERVLEFTKLEQEPPLESKPNFKPRETWPQFGEIEFIHMSMSYGANEPNVLKNVNLSIHSQEKVGIVGRTGAGKSSLITALFRLSPFSGLILIDDVDIKEIGLHDLRKKVSIIPQEPILFSGTLRYNLDPFKEFSDELLINALVDVEIKFAIKQGIECLDHVMSEGGTNLSSGQRQLVCLARAILRNNKILVMDEATANVDPHTDELIQKTIRTKFSRCTVLTIAHRLHTIIDSDRVIVMDAGSAVEFDNPYILLQNKYSYFSNMVEKTDPKTAVNLKQLAKKHYEANNPEIMLETESIETEPEIKIVEDSIETEPQSTVEEENSKLEVDSSTSSQPESENNEDRK